MLATEQLQTLVPAAFATKPADYVSDKYQFVRTIDVVDMMRDDGWHPIQAYQQNVRSDAKLETTKHVIVMRHGQDDGSNHVELGGLSPTFRMINSHDHSSKLLLIQELLRKVCDNGLMVHEGDSAVYNVRHDQIHEDLSTVMARYRSNASRAFETAIRWSQVQLSPEEWLEFGRKAAQIRYGDAATEGHARAIMQQRRAFDAGSDLFKAFNRAQENGMRGGVKAGQMTRRSRALTNIGASYKFNDELRAFATKFASERS